MEVEIRFSTRREEEVRPPLLKSARPWMAEEEVDRPREEEERLPFEGRTSRQPRKENEKGEEGGEERVAVEGDVSWLLLLERGDREISGPEKKNGIPLFISS